jgi:hypothetical protein
VGNNRSASANALRADSCGRSVHKRCAGARLHSERHYSRRGTLHEPPNQLVGAALVHLFYREGACAIPGPLTIEPIRPVFIIVRGSARIAASIAPSQGRTGVLSDMTHQDIAWDRIYCAYLATVRRGILICDRNDLRCWALLWA